jgi:hypothetical protein
MDLFNSNPYLAVGESKSEAGEGRTIPLNSELLEAMVDYSKWYTNRFGTIQPHWYVFAFGKPWPTDPTRPVVSLKPHGRTPERGRMLKADGTITATHSLPGLLNRAKRVMKPFGTWRGTFRVKC